MLSRTAKIVVPRLLKLMSAGRVNTIRCTDNSNVSNWATPQKIVGVPNLYKLNNDLYRSGQPSIRGFRNLDSLGIRSCISFRTHHTDNRAATGTAVLCKSIPIFGAFISEDDIVEALIDIHYRMPKPVLIHCYQGADRTGLFCAAYRMAVEHWSKEQAIAEMTTGGFGYHGIYHPLVNILNSLDINKIQCKLRDFALRYEKMGFAR